MRKAPRTSHNPYSRFSGKAKIAILAVALVIPALAWFAYLSSVPNPGAGCGDPCPVVAFNPIVRDASGVTIEVAAVVPSPPLSSLEVRLAVDNVTRATLVPLRDGGIDWVLSFHDRDGNGRLSGGDAARVDVTAGGTYRLSLIRGGVVLASADWTT